MKRVAELMLALMLAVIFSGFAFGAEEIKLIVKNNPSDPVYDDEGYRQEPYEFETLTDALNFAIDPSEVETPEDFTEVTIEFQKNISLEEEDLIITLSDYNNGTLTKLKLTGRSTITALSNERHIIADDSDIEFELSGLTLKGNSGGGIRITDGTVVINGVSFQDIDATENSDSEENDGGAMKITGGKVSFMGTNNFVGNTANNGGAIYAATDNDVNFQDGTYTFEKNTANENGGALYLADASNASAAMYQSNNASVSASNFIIGPFTIGAATGFKFIGNTGLNGGAIWIMPFAILILSGNVDFTNNWAIDNGGAICVHGRIVDNTSSLTFNNNKAGSTVWTPGATDPTITLPTSGFGGAIYFDNVTSMQSNFGQTEFNSNTALLGGAVYVNRGTVNFNNTASFGVSGGNTSYIGGALYLNGGSTNFNSNVSFDNNVALDHGGAIYTVQNGSEALNFTSPVSFTGNIANFDKGNLGDGGAVWWGMNVTPDFFNTFNVVGGVTFTNNKTDGSSTTHMPPNNAGNGGAIYIANSGTLTIDTTTNYQFSGNTAWNKGGVIYTDTANIKFSGVTINTANTAMNGGGGLVASASGLIEVENSVIDNQTACAGGAIFAANVAITSSDFTNNSTFTATHPARASNGGAVYAFSGGTLTAKSSKFMKNSAQNTGGAVFAETSTININDSYFQNNTAKSDGGAIEIDGVSTTTISKSTFEGNNSGLNGGAIHPSGTITINTSYFSGNFASGMGGAVYFSQVGSGSGKFAISSSMLQGNISIGSSANGYGGAMCLIADEVTIDSCTFDQNSVTGGTDARGGAVYLDVSGTASPNESSIVNSTFTGNNVEGGTNSNCGGALYTSGKVTIKSSTFTMGNSATDKGGAIYISNPSTTTIMATIIVGNMANLGSDVYADNTADCIVGIYNRVGIYAYAAAGDDPNKFDIKSLGSRQNTSWITATFYSTNGLADNIWDVSKPPLVGCSGQDILLQTLMLNEASTLPLDDTAIDIIPWSLRVQLPRYDQRGVDRWNSSRNKIDIGPLYFGEGTGNPTEPITTYTIESIAMSGIPNTLRSIGQTASLIAMIRYTNNRTAYGGDDEGSEPVVWSSSNPSIVKIDQKGNITALATTPSNSHVTISVSTKRNTAGGSPATDSRPVRVLGQYSFLNISAEYQRQLTSYIQELAEHDIAISLVDANASNVKSSSFQRAFKAAWNTDKATQITDLTTSAPVFETYTSYNASGYIPSKNAAANINFQSRSNGDVFPLVYSWTFTGSEIKALTGYDLSGKTLNAKLADELFNSLRIDFQGASKVFQVVGGSGVSAKDAYSNQALKLTKADGNKGLNVELTAYLANVTASGNAADSPQLMGSGSRKLLVVPDGTDDGAITGSMWMIQKGSAQSDTPNTPSPEGNAPSTPTPNDGNSGNNSGSGGGSGGGGGCNSLSLGLLALMFIFRRR